MISISVTPPPTVIPRKHPLMHNTLFSTGTGILRRDIIPHWPGVHHRIITLDPTWHLSFLQRYPLLPSLLTQISFDHLSPSPTSSSRGSYGVPFPFGCLVRLAT
jgi:hypothetical protein